MSTIFFSCRVHNITLLSLNQYGYILPFHLLSLLICVPNDYSSHWPCYLPTGLRPFPPTLGSTRRQPTSWHVGGPAIPSLSTHGQPGPVCFSLDPHFAINRLHIMSSVNSWKSKSEESATSDVCKVCSSCYPVCQTCSKYGRKAHANYTERQRGAHDNPAYVNTEKKDPRDKLW